MIIHYKTYSDTGYKTVLKNKIKYCCREIKDAISGCALEFSTIELFLVQPNDYGEGNTHFYCEIKYCPFCGEEIDYIEDYLVKVTQKTVTIPAHTETQTIEHKIKSPKVLDKPE
jgi:hypothetical protein